LVKAQRYDYEARYFKGLEELKKYNAEQAKSLQEKYGIEEFTAIAKYKVCVKEVYDAVIKMLLVAFQLNHSLSRMTPGQYQTFWIVS